MLKLTERELQEAGDMIGGGAGEWLATPWRGGQTIWCIELRSNGLEAVVLYMKRSKTCQNFDPKKLAAGDYKSVSNTPKARALCKKYDLVVKRR